MPLKLKIKAVPKGRYVMLCDDNGEPLPLQVSSELAQPGPDDFARFTVTFLVDGKSIVMEPD